MNKLNVNELLKYGFSGVLFFLAPLISFKQGLPLIKALPSNLLGLSAVLGVVLVIGSAIYALHRAILFPLFYKIGWIVVYGRKQAYILKLDFKRWSRYMDSRSLQKNSREWASQIHFLYCSTCAVVPLALTYWSSEQSLDLPAIYPYS